MVLVLYPDPNSGFFQRKKVAKFHFTHSKLRKRPFVLKFNRKMTNFKFQALPAPSDAHVPRLCKQRHYTSNILIPLRCIYLEKVLGALYPSCVQRCGDLLCATLRFFDSIRIVLFDDFCSFFNRMT